MNAYRGPLSQSGSLATDPAHSATQPAGDRAAGDHSAGAREAATRAEEVGGLRARLLAITHSCMFQKVVIGAIILNSIVLGIETYPGAMAAHGDLLHRIDIAFLCFFVAELSLRIAANGRRFFQGRWNLFDFAIVMVSLLPFLGNLSALRALRILRALRLLTAVPVFQKILQGISLAFRNSSPVAIVLGVIMYVYAVMSSKLFGGIDPVHFGDLDTALFTLFQVVTLDAWTEIIRPIIAEKWYAAIFFVSFILIAVFILLSIVIGIASDAMSSANERPTNEDLMHAILKVQQDRRAQATPATTNASAPPSSA